MLHSMVKQTAEAYPTHIAITEGMKRITYQDLYHRVLGLSSGLRRLGIGQGDCVALVLANCAEFAYSFFALATIKALVLPLNPQLKESELRYCMGDAGAKAVITDSRHLLSCRAALSTSQHSGVLIVIDDTCTLPGVVRFSDVIAAQPCRGGETDVYSGDVLYQYSSGSTGRPKRVCRTQEHLYHEARNFTATASIVRDDVILGMVPLFHAHGLGNCLLAAIHAGARLVLLEQQKHTPGGTAFALQCPKIFELIETEQVTVLPGVPSIFQALGEAPSGLNAHISSVRLCFSAGNFLPRAIFEQFRQRFATAIRQLYGCTEAGSVAMNTQAHICEENWQAVGHPIQQVEIKIVSDTQEEVGENTVGEIAIKSPALTTGYCNAPEIENRSFKDAWFFTGDLGRRDPDGCLYITGRKKIFIDTGGYKVDPFEIEDVLLQHPRISEAVVLGVRAFDHDELIKAVIVPKDGCSEHDVLAYCERHLADFKLPRMIEFRTELPKSPLGKVLRKDLIDVPEKDAALLRAKTALSQLTSHRQLQLFFEAYLQEHCASLFRRDLAEMDLTRSLGELGLTSIGALELSRRLTLTLGQRLSPTLLWAYPTIASLAGHLAEKSTDARGGQHKPTPLPAEQSKAAGDLLSAAEIERLSADEVHALLARWVAQEQDRGT
jgi:long-chain acyl-CoA synthetase